MLRYYYVLSWDRHGNACLSEAGMANGRSLFGEHEYVNRVNRGRSLLTVLWREG